MPYRSGRLVITIRVTAISGLGGCDRVSFFAYFLAHQESRSPAGASPGKVKRNHNALRQVCPERSRRAQDERRPLTPPGADWPRPIDPQSAGISVCSCLSCIRFIFPRLYGNSTHAPKRLSKILSITIIFGLSD